MERHCRPGGKDKTLADSCERPVLVRLLGPYSYLGLAELRGASSQTSPKRNRIDLVYCSDRGYSGANSSWILISSTGGCMASLIPSLVGITE